MKRTQNHPAHPRAAQKTPPKSKPSSPLIHHPEKYGLGFGSPSDKKPNLNNEEQTNQWLLTKLFHKFFDFIRLLFKP